LIFHKELKNLLFKSFSLNKVFPKFSNPTYFTSKVFQIYQRVSYKYFKFKCFVKKNSNFLLVLEGIPFEKIEFPKDYFEFIQTYASFLRRKILLK
jgi:hypothetical protein